MRDSKTTPTSVVEKTMGLPTSYSCVSAAALSILTFAAMQVFRDSLGTEGAMTILGGFLGSWFFIFLLTTVSNIETILFGPTFQTKLFPEIILCIGASVIVSGMVHRVCATTCLLFCILALYYINRISQSTYTSQPTSARPSTSKGGKGKTKLG